jgi:hypothetical protein
LSIAAAAVDLAPVVLVDARERTEHANLFHATTDFLNMFATLHVAGVIDGTVATRMEQARRALLG